MLYLPPLNAIRAFEAAGRLKSIRKAAAELSVTPGAVSRQVQKLEAHLGVRLVKRLPRSISLTAAGADYLQEISGHFSGISAATERVTGRRSKKVIKIRSYTTFTMKWLIPRLSDFHNAHHDIEVMLTTSTDEVDFEREDVDGAIRLGNGSWSGVGVDRLVKNELIPVCSPGVAAALSEPADLGHSTLLHSLARPNDWLQWLGAMNVEKKVDPYSGQKYESSILAYEAAIKGHGVAIAQRVLVEDEISCGTLRAPFSQTLDLRATTYYFIYRRDRLRQSPFRAFRDWLIAEAEKANGTSLLPLSREARSPKG